jgi:hypothetical protein
VLFVIVEQDDFPSGLDQALRNMGHDETGSAGDDDFPAFRTHSLSWIPLAGC